MQYSKVFLATISTLLIISFGCNPNERLEPSPIAVPSTVEPISTEIIEPTPSPTVESVKLPILLRILPLDWPIIPPTRSQIDEARVCDFDSNLSDRYPEELDQKALLSAHIPQSSCDWAMLALALAYQSGEDNPLPYEALQSLGKTATLNPAILLRIEILSVFYGATDLVSPPNISSTKITAITIAYDWTGMGTPVSYNIKIESAPSDDIFSYSGTTNIGDDFGETPIPSNINGVIDKEFTIALGQALTDLIPIEGQVHTIACFDNYPDWNVSITFEDGTEIRVVTNESNVLSMGGPWQMEIAGQYFFQYSSEFLIALGEIIDEIGLPIGQPMGMACGGSFAIFEQAYP